MTSFFLLRCLPPWVTFFHFFVSLLHPTLNDLLFGWPHTRTIIHFFTMYCHTMWNNLIEKFKYYGLNKKRQGHYKNFYIFNAHLFYSVHRNKNWVAEMGKETFWVSDIIFFCCASSHPESLFSLFCEPPSPYPKWCTFWLAPTRTIIHFFTMFCHTMWNNLIEKFKYYGLYKKRLGHYKNFYIFSAHLFYRVSEMRWRARSAI